MAATTRLAASSGGTRNRAGAKIAALSNLLSDSLTSLLDIGQRMRHGGGPPVLAYHIRKEYRSKKETPLHLTSVSRTRFSLLRADPTRRVLLWWQVVVRSGSCPRRVSEPLIHWELRLNWVRFVILAFWPLGTPGPDPCSLTIWLCS